MPGSQRTSRETQLLNTTMKLEIRKDIPIPTSGFHETDDVAMLEKQEYALIDKIGYMETGDSVAFPCQDEEESIVYEAMADKASMHWMSLQISP